MHITISVFFWVKVLGFKHWNVENFPRHRYPKYPYLKPEIPLFCLEKHHFWYSFVKFPGCIPPSVLHLPLKQRSACRYINPNRYLDFSKVIFYFCSMVNHHHSPPFGRICLELFASFQVSNKQLQEKCKKNYL